jgi:hypothetical protein
MKAQIAPSASDLDVGQPGRRIRVVERAGSAQASGYG